MNSELRLAAYLCRSTLWVACQCVRVPLLIFLAILEPVVSFIFGSLALLGILITLFWWSAGVPHFPFALMLGISLWLGVTLFAYYALLRLLAKSPHLPTR